MIAAQCIRFAIAIAAVTAALWGVLPGRAEACTCLPPTVESSYNNNSDVVRARVLSRAVGPVQTLYLARVQRVFKGCLQPGAYVILSTASSSATCGALLNLNTDYLINGQDNGTILGLRRLAITLCDYNVPVAQLTEHDREFLAGRTVCCGGRCVCADGTQPVQCFVDPCQVAPPCSAGECVANYCGGCSAEFYDQNGYAVCEGGCQTDEDCRSGSWCRQSAPTAPGGSSPGNECVPFVGEGERCGGFRPAWTFERCADGLVCDTPDDLVDATGVCRAPCRSDGDCKDQQYCAADGLCEDDGRCERDVECNLAGNQYPHIACVGHGVCEDYSCGWRCDVTEPECASDAECQVTGCSGQVCAPEPVITTCEFRPEYACYQDPAITTCGCQKGACGWAQTTELAMCIEKATSSGG